MSVYVNVLVHASVYRDQRASVNLEPKILAIVRDMECILGIKLWSFGSAASALDWWTISPALGLLNWHSLLNKKGMDVGERDLCEDIGSENWPTWLLDSIQSFGIASPSNLPLSLKSSSVIACPVFPFEWSNDQCHPRLWVLLHRPNLRCCYFCEFHLVSGFEC